VNLFVCTCRILSEGDHNPDACEVRQVPGQGHESGGGCQRYVSALCSCFRLRILKRLVPVSKKGSLVIPNSSRGGVRDAGRRRQEPAAGDRHRRGLEQAGQEAQEEGGPGGDRGAADARHVRGGGAPAPGDQAGGGGDAVAVQRQPPPVAVQQQLRRGARQPLRLPLLPVAGGRRRGGVRPRLRLRRLRGQGQQLLAGGGAEPPGQLLAAGGEARLPVHGPQLLLQQQAEAEHGSGAPPWRRQQHLHHTLACCMLYRVRR
jgi:hypothetical protein